MRKTYATVLALVVFGLMALSLQAQQTNVTGTWELTTNTPRGEMTSDITFTQEGEKLTVAMKSPRGDEITGTGTVKGDDIEWTITRNTPRGEFTTTYKGKVSGNTMTGSVEMGNFGSAEWTAKKK